MNWLYFAVGVAAGVGGYSIARSFVQRRLRFVDSIYSPAAPWLAGLAAALIAWPIAILPFVTTVTTTVFGVGAGLGTASAVKALRRGSTVS